MRDIPFFSIIVPVYKVEKYLEQCVDSVLLQSYQDYELILVDDGSPDKCPGMCDDFAGKNNRIRVIHKKNGGLSDARNAGLAIARGEYVLFVDADDFINDIDLLTRMSFIMEETDPDVVIFGFSKYFEKDQTLEEVRERMEYNCSIDKLNTKYSKGTVYDAIEDGAYKISACGKIIRRNVLIDHRITFREGVTNEDFEWSVQLAMYISKICVMDSHGYVYRQRDGSLSRGYSVKQIEDIENNLRSTLRFLNDMNDKNKRVSYPLLAQEMSIYMINLSRQGSEEKYKRENFARNNLYLLKYGSRFRERAMYMMCRILGVRGTLNILRIASIIKERKNS